MNRGTLFIISAPSGTGKGTIVSEILKSDPTIYFSVSATTRAPREGEKDGVNYFFISREEFLGLIKTGGMLEHTEFCGNLYGTPKKAVYDKLDAGRDVILEIETVGAMNVKAVCPDAVSIFILPPSLSELRHRLQTRGTDSEEVIARRVAEARAEIEKSKGYDFVIMNDDLSVAVGDIKTVMYASKKLTRLNQNMIEGVLQKC